MAGADEADAGTRCDWCNRNLGRELHVLELEGEPKLFCSSQCNELGFRSVLSAPIFVAPKAMDLRSHLSRRRGGRA